MIKKYSEVMKNKINKGNGFTLSEVLITLVILGVIAAITIPTLIANYRREATSAKLKKFYSTLHQVSYRAKSDGKDWIYWAEESNPISDAINGTAGVSKGFAEYYLTPYLNKIAAVENDSAGNLLVFLTDGTKFLVYHSECLHFIFDVNGEKKPNERGRDIFDFLFCSHHSKNNVQKTGVIIPYLYGNISSREEALEKCKESPVYCSGLLSFDGWEFKEDYPHGI